MGLLLHPPPTVNATPLPSPLPVKWSHRPLDRPRSRAPLVILCKGYDGAFVGDHGRVAVGVVGEGLEQMIGVIHGGRRFGEEG